MIRPTRFILPAALALTCATLTPGPSTAATQLRKSVNGAGGGVMAAGAYRVQGTLGQHAVGTSWINYPASANVGYWFDVSASTPTDVGPWLPPRAGVTALHANYPNPFNPSTSISFAVARPSRVTIRVYDVTGRPVATLVDAHVEAGAHAVPFNAAGLASGVYFCRMVAGSYSATRKLVLLK